jgi:hypothetical protein
MTPIESLQIQAESRPKSVAFVKGEKIVNYETMATEVERLEHRQCWKYGLLPPVQLLEKLTLGGRPLDKDELARADFFWNRRPRLLPIISYIAWLVVALGLPFWLFSVPALGYPLLIISAVVVNIEIVRSVRWRRQYELGIDRLILTPALTEMPASGDPS